MEKPSIQLLPEVEAEYKPAKGVLQQFADSELGYIDLNTLTLRTAKLVAARGYLVPVKKKANHPDSHREDKPS